MDMANTLNTASCSRRCLGSNNLFGRGRQNGFRIHWRRNPAIEAVLAELLPDPDKVLAAGRIFKPGTRTHAGEVILCGKSYFLKRYNCRGPWYQLRHLFKRSRALRTWKVSWGFFDAQVPIPEPLICLEERRFGLLHRSYILMEFAEGTQRLSRLWAQLRLESKLQLLDSLAEILGRMHGRGCLHGDLKWDNIMIAMDGDLPKPTLVDLDGSSLPTWRSSRARKDIDRFRRDLDRFEADERLRQMFLDSWEKWVS